MRYQLLDNEQVNLNGSLFINSLDADAKYVGNVVVVFNENLQVLPMVSDWLSEELESQTAPSSIKTYANNITYFLDYLKKLDIYENHKLDSAFLDIQKHTILEYFSYLKFEKNLSTKTIRNRDATIRTFFNNYLCEPRKDNKVYRKDNPYHFGLLSASPKSKLRVMCSVDDLISLMKCSHSERERSLLQFMFDTGVRRIEVPRVTKSDIDVALNANKKFLIIDDNTVIIQGLYKPLSIKGAKGKKREIKYRQTLPSISTLGRVKRYLSSPEYRYNSRGFGIEKPAFINSKGKAYTAKAISKVFEKLSKRAQKRGYIERPITPHMLRHGFAGSLLRSPDLGNDTVDRLLTLKHCLGHVNLSTTEVYTSLPYEIYGKIVNKNGRILTRAEIMERVHIQTKKRVTLKRMRN